MATLSLNTGTNTFADNSFIASYHDVPNGYTFGIDAITPIDDYMMGVSSLEKDLCYGDMVAPIINLDVAFEKQVQADSLTKLSDEPFIISNKTAHHEICCAHVANQTDVFSAIAVMMRWAAVLVMIVIMATLIMT